jgi:hypothetical protein
MDYCIDPRRFSLQSHNLIHIPINAKEPDDLVAVRWTVDGASGCSECEAWEAQHEIDCLQAAGYSIVSVELI